MVGMNQFEEKSASKQQDLGTMEYQITGWDDSRAKASEFI
jgi:hypothetical protein